MTTPERVEESARSFLDDHPEAEDALRELVAIDSEGPWAFEDTDLDSGRFGELVSRECVDSVDGDYRFADRTAVRAALGEESVARATGEDEGVDISVSLPTVDARAAVGLVVALVTVAGARMMAYGSVFQEGYVVSPANDPYFYRYWQERMFETGENATAVEMLANVPGDGRAMTHYPNWFFGDLLGGTPEAAEPVVAWLPIVSAVLTALCLYAIAVLVTDDQRIALTSVLFLALTPVHAIYTGLGFLEHRPHQYFWLAVLVLSLVWLATDVRRRLDTTDGSTAARDHSRNPRSWAVAAVLAIAVFGSVFSWAGSPITFVPVAAYLGFRVLADVRAEVSPLHANAPTLAGIVAGTVLVVVMHLQFGWDESLAVAAPILVTLGGLGVVALAALWHSLDRSPLELFVGETAVALALSAAFWLLRPEDVGRLQARAGQLFGREGATETSSLFALDNIIIEPMTQLGGGFYLALVGLAVATVYVTRRYEPGWLLLALVGWYYLALASIQVRFAAHLSIVFSLFAAVALLYGLAWMDLVRTPSLLSGEPLEGPTLQIPDSTAIAGYLVGAVAVVLLLNLIFLPSFVSQANYDSDEFGAAVAILDHANDTNHHSEFVLSQWGTNRMYNYFVTGESHNYAKALQHHEEFVTDTDADEWSDQFFRSVGYIVLEERDVPDATVHAHLFEEFGAGENGVGHYQLLYSTNSTRAFVVVKGATLRVSGPANGTVTARTDVSRAGESFRYERTVRANRNGTATIDVAYPGTYDVGGQSVRVSERNVTNGDRLDIDEMGVQ